MSASSRKTTMVWIFAIVVASFQFDETSIAQDGKGNPISPFWKLDRNEMDSSSQGTLPKEIVAILGSNRGRHGNCVKCVALSPDERFLASGSRHDPVRVWDAQTMSELRSFPHPDDVDCVWFSKESRFLHTACWDGWIRSYDLESKSNEPVSFHVDDARFVARPFNEGGQVWVTNSVIQGKSQSQLVELEWRDHQWKKTGRVRRGSELLYVGFEPLAISADGRWLATRSHHLAKTANDKKPNRKIAIWDLANADEKPSREIAFEGAAFAIMQFDPAAKHLVYADSGEGVRVIALDKNSEQQLLASERLQGRTVCFTPDGKQLVVGDHEGRIHTWNWNDGSPSFFATIEAHDDEVSEIIFNKKQSRMYSAGWDHLIHTWEQVDGTWIRNELLGHHHSVCSIAISSDGGWMATGSNAKIGGEKVSNDVLLWRVDGNKANFSKKLSGCIGSIKGLTVSRDGSYLAAAYDLGIQVWNMNSNEEGKLIQCEFQDKDQTKKLWGQSVAFLGDSHRIITGWNNGMVKLIDVDSNPPRELDSCKVPFNYVEQLAVSNSGKRVYTSSITIDVVENSLHMAVSPELTAGEKKNKNPQPEIVGNFEVYRPTLPTFGRVAIRDDSQIIVGSGREDDITIISVDGAKTKTQVIKKAHNTRIESVLINHSGLIVSGDWDGVVRVRSLDSPNKIKNQWQLGRIWSTALSPDQQHVAIGDGTGLTYVLRLAE